jgi:hypothetical protein
MSYKTDVPRYCKCPSRGGDYVGNKYVGSVIKCELFSLERKMKRTIVMCRGLIFCTVGYVWENCLIVTRFNVKRSRPGV